MYTTFLSYNKFHTYVKVLATGQLTQHIFQTLSLFRRSLNFLFNDCHIIVFLGGRNFVHLIYKKKEDTYTIL